MSLESRQIGISLLAFSPQRLAGAGTYTVGLTRALTSRAPDRYTVFVPRLHERLWRELLDPSVKFVVCGPDPDRRILRVLFEQRILPKTALRRGAETIFFPHLFAPRWRRPRAVVTVYDLLLLSKKTDFPWYKRAYHRWAYQEIAKRAARMVTISEFCRADIVERLAVASERVTVAPPGLDPEFLAEPDRFRQRLKLPSRYILAVAGGYPHKRLLTLLDAFALLSREFSDLSLVIAGTYAGRSDIAQELLVTAEAVGLGGRVRCLPRLERADLPSLFAGALALVSASEFEGFGIPIVEAMAVGCPVAASPAQAVVEVLGGFGWVASDFSAAALATAARSALGARQVANGVLSQARDRARSTYTWAASAATVETALGVAAT